MKLIFVRQNVEHLCVCYLYTHGRVPRECTGSPLAFRCILSCLCDNNVTTCYHFRLITVLQSRPTQLVVDYYVASR